MGRKRKEENERLIKVGTSLKKTQLDKLEKHFPANQQLQSKAIQGAINLFLQGLKDFGDEFALAFIISNDGGGRYKVVRVKVEEETE